MKIALVASEAAPFLKTGGLGDVMQALPAALSKMPENEVVLILPYYSAIKYNPEIKTEHVVSFEINLAWRKCHVGLFRLKSRKKLQVYFVDNEQYFNRGSIYGEGDDGERFAYFSKAVLACLGAVDFKPDVLHCNDWQTALIPMLLKSEFAAAFPHTKSVFTIHNVEYQGWADAFFNMDVLGLPAAYTQVLDFGGAANFMKSAVVMADAVTTVSETYAQQLLDPYYAHGMHEILRHYTEKLSGIVNGIDTDVFHPARDNSLEATYTSATLEQGKKANKLALQKRLGLQQDENTALLATVSRLVGHKGIDLMAYIADRLLQQNVQLVVLGTGEERYEHFFRELEGRYPGRVAVVLQFNGSLANQIYASCDLYLMPSKSEPCGLSQMIAMRYGAVPVVHATGGLKDTVLPYDPTMGEGRGFTFQSYDGEDFLDAVHRALALYYDDPKAFRALQKQNMREDFSWRDSAGKYLQLYRSITGQ